MTGIDPNTGEEVENVSKTMELRAALHDSTRSHGRAVADIVSTLEDKAWRRGWLIGVATGAAGLAILHGLYVWIMGGLQ